MNFNASKFYDDCGVKWIDHGHKRTREGWVQIHCPFCTGSQGYHLGFHVSSGAVKCWRCGVHSQIDVIRKLTSCTFQQARDIQREYKASRSTRTDNTDRVSSVNVQVRSQTKFPLGTTELTERHRRYLERRKYDPDELIKTWNLKACGPMGPYKWRIIAPIYFKKKLVSYQGRDITDKSDMKYKACTKSEEVIEHQTILYGYDEAPEDVCVLVEGIADVWRLGSGAVCCFGTSFTTSQVNLLAKRFRKVYVMFDMDEDNAIKMAEQIAHLLAARDVEVEILELEDGDPGEMSQDDANDLMKDLGFTRT